MNKKTVISATDNTILKLKDLAKKKKGVRGKLVVTAERLSPKAKQSAVNDEGNDLYKNKKTVISATDNTILKLKVLAKKKEGVRSKLAVTAKEREDVRKKLAVTAEELAVTAKEREDVRKKLAVTAEELAATAEEKEDV